MKIEKIAIDKLLLDPANARKHGQKNLDSIKGSLVRFGQQKPIVVNADNVIVAGNGTMQAAKELGWKEINIVRTDLKGSDITAFGIADNRTSELAEWDDEVLQELLEGLKAEDFDLSAIGFDIDDMNEMIGDKSKTGLTDPDDVPIQVDSICKNGDMYQLGKNVLLCGDSTDINNQSRIAEKVKYNTIVFDPPFEIDKIYSHIPLFNNKISNLIVFYDYKRCAEACHNAIVAKWPPLYEFVWDNCGSWYNTNRPLARHKACHLFGNEPKWNFDAAIIEDGKKRRPSKSFTGKDKSKAYEYVPLDGAVHLSTVFVQAKNANKEDQFYSQEKPNEWIKAILLGCNANGVFDMFAGSGAFMIACERISIPCGAIELDEHRCDIIISRWEDFTGEKAIKIK